MILALVLAGLSFFKVTFDDGKPGIAYRQSETWTSSTRLAVTQAGLPIGTPVAADLQGFALVVANLADSDAVQGMAARSTQILGAVDAQPEIDPLTQNVLPFIKVNAFATTPAQAVALSDGAAKALQTYVKRQQDAARLSMAQRVSLPVINRASAASLSAGRRKTTPIVIFLTVMIAAIGLAFILENLRPRVHQVGRNLDDAHAAARRSA